MNRFIRATGNENNINETINPGVGWQLSEIRVHLDGAGAATDLTATVESSASGENNEYDVVVLTQSMDGITDYVYQPDRPHVFAKGDKLKIEWENSNRRWGLEVVFSGTSF